MNESMKRLIVRAIHTFWQTALSTLMVEMTATGVDLTDKHMWIAAAVGAVAAGLSAVKTLLIGAPEIKK